MVPTSLHYRSPKLLLTLASVASQYVPSIKPLLPSEHTFAKREDKHSTSFVVFACLIPVFVLLSGVFAGLTLGYMSLDETQLNVLSISGTPQQKVYANKIKPIRKNGHLLLVTLLLANMIVNETLPVISTPVLGGGVQGVAVSTILIVIFSEIIPQSLCTRYGLYFGAKMAGFVRVLMWTLGIVAWPVAKALEFALGPHHGIIYRRAELKELIAMHSNVGELGGDLKLDTVNIIGEVLDLQEKVVKQAMTPIEDVFMLSIDARLDYETLRKVCLTGHSRIPVFEEVEIPVPRLVARQHLPDTLGAGTTGVPNIAHTQKVKKIVGILLVKQCVLLDPKDAVPVRKIPLNRVPFVPNNEPLLGILDKFQEGRSHMAIVSRFSVQKAASVKQAVRRGLTQRLLDRVGIGESDSSSSDEDDSGGSEHEKRKGRGLRKIRRTKTKSSSHSSDNDTTLRGDSHLESEADAAESPKSSRKSRSKRNNRPADVEMGVIEGDKGTRSARGSFNLTSLPKVGGLGRWEQSMPADAVLTKEGAEEFLQSVDPAIMPLGIITLEDVLEELIGEEIYDEFDPQGHPDLSSYVQTEPNSSSSLKRRGSAPQLMATNPDRAFLVPVVDGLKTRSPSSTPLVKPTAIPALKSLNFKGLAFARPRSAPPIPREEFIAQTEKFEGTTTPATVPEGVVLEQDIVEFSEKQLYSPDESIMTLPRARSPAVTPEAPMPVPPPPPPPPPPPIVVVAPTGVPATAAGARSKLPGSGQVQAQGTVPPISTVPSLGVSFAPPSRSGSPASLEQAILMERKRRATAGTSQAVPKGARFKSSPLTGDRNGVVVAERVRRELGRELGISEALVEDDRIADEWHKEGSE